LLALLRGATIVVVSRLRVKAGHRTIPFEVDELVNFICNKKEL